MEDNRLYELRKGLEKIFNPILNNKKISLKLDKLKISHSHNISIYQSVEHFEKEFSENYTCFEYALGLHTSTIYKKIRSDLALSYMRGIFCNSCFIKWLEDNKKLEQKINKGMEAIIIYSSLFGIKHAGIIKDTTNNKYYIISKFGTGMYTSIQ